MVPSLSRSHCPGAGFLAALAGLFCAILLAAFPASGETLRVEGLEGVSRVQVFGGVEVEISQGLEAELLLRGKPNRLDPPPFYRSGDTLVLGRSADRPDSKVSGVQYRLTLAGLERLEVLGSATVYVRPLQSETLRVSLDGSADVRLFDVTSGRVHLAVRGSGDLQVAQLQADDVNLSVRGSGDLLLGEMQARAVRAVINGSGDIGGSGAATAERLSVSVVGSGDVDFRVLDGDTFEVSVIGSGGVRLGEARQLSVTIMGSGDVEYRGEPILDQSVIGSGSLSGKP